MKIKGDGYNNRQCGSRITSSQCEMNEKEQKQIEISYF
jgi:hypothetical protein